MDTYGKLILTPEDKLDFSERYFPKDRVHCMTGVMIERLATPTIIIV